MLNRKKTIMMSKYKLLLTIVAFVSFLSSKAQSVPKLKFIQPQLFSGVNGQKDAVYKFSNVVPGIDAYVQIENIYGGAVLVNIDDSTLGYYEAWQPTVGGPDTLGSYSYIKWNIEFKTTAGAIYTFPVFNASSIDVDGDNVRVREFVEVNGYSSYDVPTQVPTLLQISEVPVTDRTYGDDPNPINVHALGPVANRVGIDTFSLDVRINYHFTNSSKIKFYTGSQIDNNGSTGAIATNRYHCIYFHDVKSDLFSVLPITYSSFKIIVNKNQVFLAWTSDTKNANNVFEVEKSFDQKEFRKIGRVLISQSVNGVSGQYSFIDDANEFTKHKEVFYRLKLIDQKGGFTYSIVKMMKLTTLENTEIQVLPNPYMEKLNVNFQVEDYNKAEIRLINMSGNVIASTQATVTKGMNTIQLANLNSKASGLYVVNLIIDGKLISSQKVLKN